MASNETTPWHAAFPAPTSTPSHISTDDLHARLRKDDPEILVVDLRRTDFEDAFIRGAINLPAHSFYPTLPGLIPILSRYKVVVFHCQSCSPTSRGARAAAWYQDALDERKIVESQAYILDGGIREWLAKYRSDALTIAL